MIYTLVIVTSTGLVIIIITDELLNIIIDDFGLESIEIVEMLAVDTSVIEFMEGLVDFFFWDTVDFWMVFIFVFFISVVLLVIVGVYIVLVRAVFVSAVVL